jgi:hypothetical protein
MVIQPPAYEMEIAAEEKRWLKPIEDGELPASPLRTISHKPKDR